MPYTLVLFHAHPDDEAIATGGTMARAKSEGHRVVLVSATTRRARRVRARRARAGRDARRPAGRRAARGGRRARRRPGRVPRLPRLRHGRRADQRRARLVRERRRRRGRGAARRASSTRSTPTCSRSTTRTATTGTPTTSRCTASACARPSSPGTRRVYEATVNRDHIRRLMEQVPQEPDAPEAPADLETLGVTEDQITTTVDVRDFVDQQARGDGRAREPDPGRLVLLAAAARRVPRGVRLGVVHPPRRCRELRARHRSSTTSTEPRRRASRTSRRGPPSRRRPQRCRRSGVTGERSDDHGAYGAITQAAQREQHPVVVDAPAREVAPRPLAVGPHRAARRRRAARRSR